MLVPEICPRVCLSSVGKFWFLLGIDEETLLWPVYYVGLPVVKTHRLSVKNFLLIGSFHHSSLESTTLIAEAKRLWVNLWNFCRKIYIIMPHPVHIIFHPS